MRGHRQGDDSPGSICPVRNAGRELRTDAGRSIPRFQTRMCPSWPRLAAAPAPPPPAAPPAAASQTPARHGRRCFWRHGSPASRPPSLSGFPARRASSPSSSPPRWSAGSPPPARRSVPARPHSPGRSHSLQTAGTRDSQPLSDHPAFYPFENSGRRP